ncbi:MAG: Ger(x)C family spore germination protein [Christensenellales bacterium]
MIKRLKKTILLALCLALSFASFGCTSQRELNELSITIGIGIDKSESEGTLVKLIAQIVKPDQLQSGAGSDGGGASEEGKGGDKGKNKPYLNIESEGTNTFDAIREITHMVPYKLYSAHTQVFVIGRAVAEDGIGKYLDFFTRAVETRPLTKIIIADGTAAEALATAPIMSKIPSMDINLLVEAQDLNSQTPESMMHDYISIMASKTSAYYAPLLVIEDNLEMKTLAIRGLAVFKKDKMIGQIDESVSRGLLWVKGLVKSGVVSVKAEDGDAAVEITGAKASVKTELKDNKPSVAVAVEMEGILACQTGKKNLATEEGLAEVGKLAAQAIYTEIEISLHKAQELNADIFGFGEEFHKYHLGDWKELEENWEELFPSLEVSIDVKAKITSAGVISRPVTGEDTPPS